MVPTSRVGIVVYRDQGDEYVVKWTDLSFRTDKLQEFLSHIDARGGGDWEEAVKEGLDAAINELKWRKKSKRIIVLVGGSPPHARGRRGGHPARARLPGPGRRHQHHRRDEAAARGVRPQDVALAARQRAVQAVRRCPSSTSRWRTSFGGIARDGGGELVSLDEDKVLIREVLELTFGSRWKVEMAKYLKELS